MTDEEHAARLERIRADRIAAGREPHITSPVVYRLLDAILASNKDENPTK